MIFGMDGPHMSISRRATCNDNMGNDEAVKRYYNTFWHPLRSAIQLHVNRPIFNCKHMHALILISSRATCNDNTRSSEKVLQYILASTKVMHVNRPIFNCKHMLALIQHMHIHTPVSVYQTIAHGRGGRRRYSSPRLLSQTTQGFYVSH